MADSEEKSPKRPSDRLPSEEEAEAQADEGRRRMDEQRGRVQDSAGEVKDQQRAPQERREG
jgi:hypothetical protein